MCPLLEAKEFDKKYFRDSYWFCNNHDSAFYKEDTIGLIKYSNPAPEGFSGYSESELFYLGHGDFVTLRFSRFGHLQFAWRVGNSLSMAFSGDFRWSYVKKAHALQLVKDSVLFGYFKPLKERKIMVPSKNAVGPDSLCTVELKCVRIH